MASPKNSQKIAQLADLIVGSSGIPEADLEVLRSFLARAGIGKGIISGLLEQSFANWPSHVIRLLAIQLYFEKTKPFDGETKRGIGAMERRLQQAAWSTIGGEVEFEVPFAFRRGAHARDQRASVDAAEEMIARVARELGAETLAGKHILDIGCGVKFTQVLYGRQRPVERYHGVDVDREMIEFLSSNVNDPRFTYKQIDVYNERYHKTGAPLSCETDIGAEGQTFDAICLFSVFTHLAPADYRAMLELARKYISPTGKLIFTSFIDDTILEDFKDMDPAKPLFKAHYRESVVRELAVAAKWSIECIFLRGAQHWIICSPA